MFSVVQQLSKTFFSSCYCYCKSTEQNPTELDIVWYNFINSFFFFHSSRRSYEKGNLTKHLLEALKCVFVKELQKTEIQCLNSVQMGFIYFVCFEFPLSFQE